MTKVFHEIVTSKGKWDKWGSGGSSGTFWGFFRNLLQRRSKPKEPENPPPLSPRIFDVRRFFHPICHFQPVKKFCCQRKPGVQVQALTGD